MVGLWCSFTKMMFFYFHDKMSSYIMICHDLYPKNSYSPLSIAFLFIASFSVLSIAIHSDPDVPLWRKLLSITKKPFSPNPDIFIPVMKSVFLRNQRHIFRKWPLPKCNVTVILVNQNTCLPVLLQQQKYFVRHHSSVYSLTRSSKDE